MTLLSDNGHEPNHQAKAVRAYLGAYDGIEPSWNSEASRYDARVDIAEWHNGRERGFVLSMRAPTYSGRQINIAFFEHRNSDDICALVWEQYTLNPPTIDTAEFGDVYRDKYDVSHNVPVGRAGDMASWIYDRLEQHWLENVSASEAA